MPPVWAATDAMLTIRPNRCARISGRSAWVTRNADVRLALSVSCQSSRLISAMSSLRPMPALLTSTETGPGAFCRLAANGRNVTGTGRDWRKRAYSVEALRVAARSVLPRPVFDFVDGGAEDERSLRRNESAFAALRLLPRPLRGAASRDL